MRGHAFPLAAGLHVGVRKALHFIEGLVLLRALGAPDTCGYCSISIDTDLEFLLDGALVLAVLHRRQHFGLVPHGSIRTTRGNAVRQDRAPRGGLPYCRPPKLGRDRLAPREAWHYQSRSRISGSSQRSISMEWCL